MPHPFTHRAPANWLCNACGSILGLALSVGIVWADDEYVQSIVEHRRSVDAAFRDPVTSPIPDAEIPTFAGLDYFPVDPALRIPARFEPAEDTARFRMPTFNDKFLDFSQYGYLIYQDPSGAEVRLTLFQRADTAAGQYFALVPFRDLSNGKTTYSGGRYLEFTLPLSDPPVVDFNLAFNPYCAYDPGFSCPIPPQENWLDFPVFAGEKAYHHASEAESE